MGRGCVLVSLGLLCFGVLSAPMQDKVVYDDDNRFDVYELAANDPLRIIAEQSTVALVNRDSWGSPDASGNHDFLHRGVYSDSQRLVNRRSLCSTERYLLDTTFVSPRVRKAEIAPIMLL
jgi:hypothetical protein